MVFSTMIFLLNFLAVASGLFVYMRHDQRIAALFGKQSYPSIMGGERRFTLDRLIYRFLACSIFACVGFFILMLDWINIEGWEHIGTSRNIRWMAYHGLVNLVFIFWHLCLGWIITTYDRTSQQRPSKSLYHARL